MNIFGITLKHNTHIHTHMGNQPLLHLRGSGSINWLYMGLDLGLMTLTFGDSS